MLSSHKPSWTQQSFNTYISASQEGSCLDLFGSRNVSKRGCNSIHCTKFIDQCLSSATELLKNFRWNCLYIPSTMIKSLWLSHSLCYGAMCQKKYHHRHHQRYLLLSIHCRGFNNFIYWWRWNVFEFNPLQQRMQIICKAISLNWIIYQNMIFHIFICILRISS